MLVSVEFRGEMVDVEIDHDGGYEPDTNAHEIDWHFYGMTPEQDAALEITDAEYDSIYDQLCKWSYDNSGRFDDDVI